MKNSLLEYYGIKTDNLYKDNRKYIFKYNNQNYVIERVYSSNNLSIIMNYINTDIYDKIIKNKYGNIITTIDGKDYILLKKSHKNYNIYNRIINNISSPINKIQVNKINWIKLWKEKIDYYESIKESIYKYDVIKESLEYYVGMSETAIAYIEYNLIQQEEMVVLSHKRINNEDYLNPTNILMDNRARDVSEFLKYSFFYNNDNNDAINIIDKIDFSINEYILLYGRLFFQNFYFDICDKIINNQAEEKELQKIIEKSQEYELWLKKVYIKINNKIKIPKINWI